MKDNMLLDSETAYSLYASIKDLPIIDYHCHLDAKAIYEDTVFDNIGRLWLECDHYKWRLMRACGISEELITGSAGWQEKFTAYTDALSRSPGNPLYYWSCSELSKYFETDIPINKENADRIWNESKRSIANQGLSPRRIMEISNVETVCTTNDICEMLEYHKLMSGLTSFHVLPTFRTDKLFFINSPEYREYIKKLSKISGAEINDLRSLKKAVENRLRYFISMGARFADVGIEHFPEYVLSDDAAEAVFAKALFGKKCTYEEIGGFSGNLLAWLNRLYAREGIISQLHVSVKRNVNEKVYKALGADVGIDCISDEFHVQNLINLFNAVDVMPKTVVYMLDSAHTDAVIAACGSFPNVSVGAAWWFCDNRRGIENVLSSVSEQSSLGSFLGMLTDSRSFLSLSRHDFFRRILCNFVAKLVDSGEYPDIQSAQRLCADVSYYNIKKLIGEV